MPGITFRPASHSEADALASLRVRVMRPSLEAAGRFDPQRARTRFLSKFDPKATWVIEMEGVLVGFFVLRDNGDHLYLDHLYVDLPFQNRGLGRAVVSHTKNIAHRQAKPVRLIALSQSPANGFYVSCGFRVIAREGLDVTYEWCPEPGDTVH